LSALALVCGAIVYIGVAPDRFIPWDLFFPLDGAWRVLQGQRPHVDFYTPLGPLTYMIYAVGLWLAGLDIRGVGVALGITGCILGIWAWLLARPRLGFAASAALSLGLALLVITPRPIAFRFNLISPASSFNRLGYALAGLVAIESLSLDPGKKRTARDLWIGGASTGLLCAASLFLKVTYGFASIGLAVVGWLLAGSDRGRTSAMLLAFALGVFAMLAYLRFDVGSVWSDLRIAGGSKTVSWQSFRQAAIDNLPLFVPLLGIAAAAGRSWLRCVLTGLAFTAGGMSLSVTNTSCPALPLATVFAIMLADWLAFQLAPGLKGGRLALQGGLIIVATIAGLFPVVTDALSVAIAVLPSTSAAQRVTARLSEPHLARYIALSGQAEGNRGTDYFAALEEGMQLLRTHAGPSDTVMTLDFVNPFEFAMQRPVARGGATFMQYGFDFTDRSKPSPEWLVGNFTCVMVAKRAVDYKWSFEALLRNYLPYVESRFRNVAGSERWQLYCRR
jgi:hypothetical protein